MDFNYFSIQKHAFRIRNMEYKSVNCILTIKESLPKLNKELGDRRPPWPVHS